MLILGRKLFPPSSGLKIKENNKKKEVSILEMAVVCSTEISVHF
jgi:hypothetical protein